MLIQNFFYHKLKGRNMNFELGFTREVDHVKIAFHRANGRL